MERLQILVTLVFLETYLLLVLQTWVLVFRLALGQQTKFWVWEPMVMLNGWIHLYWQLAHLIRLLLGISEQQRTIS